MFKKIFFLFFLVSTISVKAHQPDVSTTMLVEKENNIWVLQISASLSAFQQEINTHFSETPYKTPEEFKQMVLEHIKNNLDITFNNTDAITLSDGLVKLGHETKVVFEVFGIPSEIISIQVKNSAFKDIHKNQSALVLLKKGFNKEHFVLNNANNHTLKLTVVENKFVAKTQNEAHFFSNKILFISLVIIAVGFLFRKVYLQKVNN